MTSHASRAAEPTGSAGVGDLIDGRYQLLGPLGSGDGVERWQARDVRLNRDVEVGLDYSIPGDGEVLHTYLDRALASAGSNPVQVYDAGSHSLLSGSCTFIVTPSQGVAAAEVHPAGDPAPLSVGQWSAPVYTERSSRRSPAHGASPARGVA
ncbi:MAG: hypothetical protein JWQ77_3836, partial [Jatrophihabitans sp.]|nr:hypothetical protein [Jatrophihabitans sp.]